MSSVGQDRSSRWQEIEKGLQFIQSTLPFPGGQEQYEIFIQDLVRNLFGEGNDVFHEGEWARSVELYTEALNIAEYADSEDILIACELREKLHANRAASYLNIGLHDQALVDCEKALQLNDKNHRALYRKARSLKEMGRHQDAYEAVAKCSMAVPQDTNVIQLTQELAKMLGLKIRKAYVRGKVWYILHYYYCIASVSSMSASLHLPPLLSHPMLVATQCTVNLPAPYNKPVSSSYSLGLDTFASPLDSLDSLSISEPQSGVFSFFYINTQKLMLFLTVMPRSFHHKWTWPRIHSPTLMSLNKPALHASELVIVSQAVELLSNIALHDLLLTALICSGLHTVLLTLRGYCVPTGPGVLDFSYHPEDHKCKKDLLLGRLKHSDNLTWKLIRPRPTKNQYVGPYYICKDVANGEECKYRGHCTFAYCQEEIDVWTLERKGFISRDLLCDPYGARMKVTLSVPKILQEHQGIFMFLCQVCFDHKPRIISKLNKDNPAVCSHPVTKHVFEEHKCLVHVLKDVTLSYSKIRPYFPTCQLDLCRHAVRYGCQREDYCFYAHSLIELKVWVMQREQGITHESIVQEAKKFWNIESNSQVQFGPSNLKMQFVCEQCWRNGQVSEPDKNRKYCSAKARHIWSKDRQVVLVSSIERRKWIQMRSLPTRKPAPSQFEICMHVAAGKKCQYIGNCTFAHSPEEKDLWTYMKDNNIADMGQLYELWLQSQKPSCSAEGSSSSTKENGKQIHLPTDYAEEMAGNHCWLCGKNCNSEKQWQQHITSEKHKDRVFNSEDDLNCWQYRFPTGTFKVCEFRIGTCTEEELCKLAHGEEELKEWQDRREFLLQRLAKARNDHLLAPNDNDFGKYSFLLKDLK
uniref:Zinc finger CCCH-type containing 7A n=1 Tax=Astyanax mexicanus TaxID=7994 RepID=A0A8B9KIP4_ASTMX